VAILVKITEFSYYPSIFAPFLKEKVSLGIGYWRWRSKMRMMGQSGRKEVWQ